MKTKIELHLKSINRSIWAIPTVILFALSTHAASFTVLLRDFSFTPKTLTINVGDTVNWVSQEGAHDVQSNTGATPAFKSSPPPVSTFSFTFTQPGTVAYHCNPHVSFGMTGSVIVKGAANQPPVIALTSPANGTTVPAGQAITISANASDDGSVSTVEFFDGATSLGINASAPYSITTTLAAGSHTLTAKATDNLGSATVSGAVTINVTAPANQAPNVSITSPINGSLFNLGDNINIAANATDSDGSVVSVEFFDGTTSLGLDPTSPFSISTTLGVGSHTLTAKATDNAGGVTVSAGVNITVNGPVNKPPTVVILSPANGATFNSADIIQIKADAADSDGSIVSVEFFDGAASLGIETSAPYGIATTLPAGSHTITARASDNAGASTVSTGVNIVISEPANNPPTVAVTSPANGAIFNTGDAINIAADASDADGSVVSVEFFDGTTSLGVDTSAPYGFSLSLSSGTHTITARATDNSNLDATSAAVSITINTPANQPPNITVTSPISGSLFNEGDIINLAADAFDPDGTVVSVEFFDGATSLGIDTTSPYGISTTLPPGAHTIHAKAADNAGGSSTSGEVTVNVNAAGNPPSISITAPADNATFDSTASITLQAAALDSGGTITKVEFFDGSVSLGSVTASPYSLSVVLQPNRHVITAVATDNSGAAATSAAINLNVTTRPTLAITRISATEYQIATVGVSGIAHTPQRSSNLLNDWVDVATLFPARGTGTITFTDTVPADQGRQFYRVIIK